MGMEDVVNFSLQGEGFGGYSRENMGPEGGKDVSKGGRGGGVSGEILFQPRVDVRVVDHGGETGVAFSRGFERQSVLDSFVEALEELMNSGMGNFGEETSERKKVNGGLVERIRDMGWVHIRDKACFLGKWKGVKMSVWETV